VDFDVTGQLLVLYSAFVKYLGQVGTQRGSVPAVDGRHRVRRGPVYYSHAVGITLKLFG
jgi:hypothetical protein